MQAVDRQIKSNIIQGYLNQQLAQTGQMQQGALMQQSMHVPSNVELEEFKTMVKAYMELDGQIKKIQQVLKERRDLKQDLSHKVLAFMAKYNIEDLNTKDGKLRYRVSQVKPTMSKKQIKDRLLENYSRAQSAEELLSHVFDSNEKIERQSLRRVTIRNAN
jgi:citrate synthase